MADPKELWVDGEAFFDGSCSVDHPRACEVNVSILMVKALASEAGVEPVAIEEIEAQTVFTEDQARAAVQRTIAAMPDGPAKSEAEAWAREGGLRG